MKLSKSKLSKLHNKKAQTRKQRLVKKKQKERQRGGKKPKSILKTKRKYSRPFNLRYKTLRNIQKRKRDRKHNKPRKIRFLLKGGQEDQTTKTGIELTPLKKEKERVPERKSENVNSQSKALSMTKEDLAIPVLSHHRQETSKKKVKDVLKRINKDDKQTSKHRTKSKEEVAPPSYKQATSTTHSTDPVDEETKYDIDEETKDDDGQKTIQQNDELGRLKRFQLLRNKQTKEVTQVAVTPKEVAVKPKEEEGPKEVASTTPTEPVRTTMSTDENDDYKIITVKVYYPKKALTNVISDSGNSTAQTLNVLTSK